ncbi:MAG: hypothetical protein WKF85_03040 [Chitinophagaceae bacterium]
MIYYNIYVENSNDTFTLLKTPEDDLNKLVEAYELGKEAVFINGEKIILNGLKVLKIFSFNDSWDTLNDFLNTEDVREHMIFSRLTGRYAVHSASLGQKGADLTKQYLKNDYGWKKIPDYEDNILKLKKHYINMERIEQFKKLKNEKYDFKKLIRICEEINICYNLDCTYAVGNLLRTLIDHIAPIFGQKSFAEVANNYAKKGSFKEAMQHLENSLRNISNLFLHTPIKKTEVLPTENQVEFIAPIDLLLAEVIMISNIEK